MIEVFDYNYPLAMSEKRVYGITGVWDLPQISSESKMMAEPQDNKPKPVMFLVNLN